VGLYLNLPEHANILSVDEEDFDPALPTIPETPLKGEGEGPRVGEIGPAENGRMRAAGARTAPLATTTPFFLQNNLQCNTLRFRARSLAAKFV